MKKYIALALCAVAALSGLTSCSDDDLSDTSVITSKATEKTPFDAWIKANFTDPYNIAFLYRYEDIESDMSYYVVPADYDKAVKLAHIVKYTCVDTYDQIAGTDFTRTYFPKMFFCTGDWEYNNNGTIILGTAEGGKKIFLAGVNHLDEYLNNRSRLNEYYLKTIHHEFTHILNQTKDYPQDFAKVTGTGYVNDSWSTSKYETGYLKRGFITDYSQKEAREDFAEMMSTYILNTPEQWEEWMDSACVYKTDANGKRVVSDASGREALEKKLSYVKTYMKETFNIDLDKLREEVLRREDNVVAGKVNLTDLTVK